VAFTIYVLAEGQMTIDGAVLDGVTQGDGSHLVGRTITLNSNAWQAVEINDNDADFADNDSGQQLADPVTIDGTTFSTGTRVEAEYSLTAMAGGETYTLVAFNIVNSSPSYATVEALAFIGSQGGFPPIGVPLTITAAQEGPSFPAVDYATPICFAAGTQIAVPGGAVPVEGLAAGDMVLTRGHGALPLQWAGARRVPALGRFAPVVFAPGVLGNARALTVSRQHRLRLSGWRAELMFGEPAVLIPAVHFLGRPGVSIAEGGWVSYHHLLFDTHQIVLAEGVEAESYHPSADNLAGLSAEGRAEVLALFPELAADGGYGPVIHPPLTAREARALLAA
jgi:hypothetical protein